MTEDLCEKQLKLLTANIARNRAEVLIHSKEVRLQALFVCEDIGLFRLLMLPSYQQFIDFYNEMSPLKGYWHHQARVMQQGRLRGEDVLDRLVDI